MRNLFSILMMIFALTAAGQDNSISDLVTNLDIGYRSKYAKYIGLKYPDFEVKLPDKSSFSNENIINKVVFINFWFASCTPCIEEIEGLNKMYTSLKDKTDFIFVSFSFDSDDLIKSSIKKYNIQYKVIHLEKIEFAKMNFGNPNPTNIILDKKSIIKYFSVGGNEKEVQNEFIMKIYYPKILSLL